MATPAASVPLSRDRFVDDLNILLNAAIGVVFIRTREPFEVLKIIKTMAFGEDNTHFKAWTMTKGWASYDRAKANEAPTYDGVANPYPAMAKINGVGEETPFPDEGYYCMMWPHFALANSQIPPMIQMIAELATILPETGRRLLMVMPPEFTIPKELEDLVPILDHNVPTMPELREAYQRAASALGARAPQFEDEGVTSILHSAMGMTLQEAESAVVRAFVEHRSQLPGVPYATIAGSVAKLKTEVIKRSEVLELMPVGTMADVGGLDGLKAWMSARKHAFSDEAAEMGVDRPKGIALIGPPGTGKSLAAKATASELGIPLVRFDVSRVFAGIVGASEGRVRAALKLLDALAPCVVLLDEVDKAFNMNSGGGDSGVGMRVLGAILTHMQETSAPLFWVMTANRVGGLPPELLRKGRLDEVFAVTLPDGDERADIFGIHLEKRGWPVADVVDLHKAVERSRGYVPAEIEAAVKECITNHYAEWVTGGRVDVIPAITGQQLAQEFEHMKPLSQAFADQFREMQVWADNNARSASTHAREELLVTGQPRTRERATATNNLATGTRRIKANEVDD